MFVETLMLGIVLLGLGLAVWKVVDGFKAKHTPKVSSGGIRPTEPTDPTKPTDTNTAL